MAGGIFITELTPPDAGGRRLAVKDLFDTAGVRTTYGSALFADHVPETTAPAVLALEAAGYANVGKANLHEFAWGITSDNPWYGRVPNPLAAGRYAGGSSGGCAAALAGGLADAALGTDSGGSIRIPSACCGTVGFKPSHGLVALDGCFALAPSFDHAGPMARDVAGCVTMLRALAPSVEVEPVALGRLRVGVAWLEHADPLVARAVASAAEHFPGAQAVELPFPGDFYAAFLREAAEVHTGLGLWPARRSEYGENVAQKLAWACEQSDAAVAAAERVRDEYREVVATAMADLDLLLTPTIAMVAPPVSIPELELRREIMRFTLPFNVTGQPALALPCGLAEDGLPASVQLVGAPGADGLVLAAGLELEDLVCTRPTS